MELRSTWPVFAFLALAGTGACNCKSSAGATGTSGEGATGAATGGGNGSNGGSSGGGHSLCADGGLCAQPLVCVASGYCVDDGGCVASGDCGAGELCDAGWCVPGSACGGQHIASAAVPPNILITLDRSCSMTQAPDGGAGMSKWAIAGGALQDLLAQLDGGAQWGLAFFPQRDGGASADAGGKCDVTAEAVPLGPGNETAISNLLSAAQAKGSANYPDGPCVTPIDSGLHASSLDPALKDPTRRSFLLLITDGEQSGCSVYGGAPGCVSIIAAQAAASPPVDTFVVGFGAEVNAKELSEFADAGGVPASGATPYYQASDQASLQAALATITGLTLGCVLQLATTPPNASDLYVFFDGSSEPESATDGWTYDATSNEILLHGAACQEVQSGQVTAVDVEFGCLFH